MLKAIKVRLYPNKEQEVSINKLLGCYRFVYNNCLALKKEAYDEDKTNLNLTYLGKYFHNNLTKNPDYEWLNEQNTKVLKQAIINMLDAYKLFFKGKGKVGFPKFKSKGDSKLSCRFPIEAISKRNNYSTNKLSLANIRNIKFKCSKRYINYLTKNKEGIKSATLSKTASGNYFLSILIDGENDKKVGISNKSVGIDLGIKTLLTLSNGEIIENPKWIKNSEKQIKKLSRQLAKKKKGSNNRYKAKTRLAKAHEKVANKRRNNLHEITSKIINENQVIVLEDLNVSGMVKNRKLSKAISDLGLYELRRQFEYKSNWYGRELVFVSRWFPSSKLCSDCGDKNDNLRLSDRTYVCTSCGCVKDRDLNASVNILSEGLRLLETG